MTLPATRPPDHLPLRLQGRARLVFGSSRRRFVYVWTAPRSPAGRVLVMPLLLVATLLILAVGLLVLIALVAVALVATVLVVLVGAPLAAVRRKGALSPRRRGRGRTAG